MPRRPETPYWQQPLSHSTTPLSPASRRCATKLDVARQYGISLRTVDTWIRQKKIPFFKLGARLVRFDLDAVAKALDRYLIKEVK